MNRPSNRVLPAVLLVACVAVVGVGGYLLFFAGKKPPVLPGTPGTGPGDAVAQEAARGLELYTTNCAACHGDKGDGNGPAARFLFPRPRNFGEAKFRLVSTSAAVPSDDDLQRVIRNGMPGSAMFAFGHLGDADIQALVGQVRRFIRAGFESRLRQAAADRGDEIDATELNETIERMTKLGEPVPVPESFPEATKESIARGVELYRSAKASCAACHGQEGKGDGQQAQLNDDGMPTRPRDFSRGIFKSGRDRRQLYVRMIRGLPGSPMPSNSSLKPEEVGDIINFILSLLPEEATARTQHRRRTLIAKRVESLPDKVPDTAWQAAAAVPIVVTPLWWRDSPEPSLQVAALHDGKSLAVRLTWHDPTRNDEAVRPQDFEDMAAVQLFKGSPEPFLGMGTADKSVDLWLWRASWRGGTDQVADVHTVYPRMYTDATGLYPFPEDKAFLAARAAGNPHADPSRDFTGSSIQAKGFGSTTMRPRVSQLVSAQGAWQNEGWTVVLRRPLEVSADGGLSLKPGDKLAIAFALWDGAARDRNGQKLVSIWHDLQLSQ
jgi:DMSO reductase family type II enzyme heme b subunit